MTELQIKCFIYLAEELNFTAAAERLHIAQSTLSQHISFLEKDLNLSLFVRTKRKVALSEGGEIMLKTFQKMIQEFDKGFNQAQNLAQSAEKILCVGYMEGLEPNVFLTDRLREFQCNHPEIKIEVYRMNNNRLIDKLEDHGLDMIFTLERVSQVCSNVDVIPVHKTPLSIIFNNKEESRAMYNLKWFNDLPFYVLNQGIDATDYSYTKSITDKINLEMKQVIEVDSVESQLLNVKLGFGIALSTHASYLRNNENISFMDIPNSHTNIIGIYHGKQPNPLVRLLLTYFM